MGFARFKQPVPRSHIRMAIPRPRVLYVEDEDINWEIAQHELEEEFDLSRAIDARDAFRLISQSSYELILLDIQLCGSEIDGIQIARLLKRHPVDNPPDYATGIHAEKTPIIFVTGYTARYPKGELLAAGGDDVIAKPVDFKRLTQAIARVGVLGVSDHGLQRQT